MPVHQVLAAQWEQDESDDHDDTDDSTLSFTDEELESADLTTRVRVHQALLTKFVLARVAKAKEAPVAPAVLYGLSFLIQAATQVTSGASSMASHNLCLTLARLLSAISHYLCLSLSLSLTVSLAVLWSIVVASCTFGVRALV